MPNSSALITLWRFLSWADKARWENRYSGRWIDHLRNLMKKNCGIEGKDTSVFILAYWLTYIYDYQIPTKQVWERVFPIMVYVSNSFIRKGLSVDAIIKSIKGEKYGVLKIPHTQWSFIHRFEKRHGLQKKVRRTLIILRRIDMKDLIDFVLWLTKGNEWVRRIATGLFLLTYDSKINIEKAVEILKHEEAFQHYFEKKKTCLSSWIWNKRLWSALKDYIRWDILRREILNEAKKRGTSMEKIKLWEKPEIYFEQLELPGDVWNKRFKKVVENIYGEKLKGDISIAVRRLYEKEKENIREIGLNLYPEQFDVTFDFVPRMCEEKRCFICPLGSNNQEVFERLCIGDLVQRSNVRKICPVLVLSFNYMMDCHYEECPVYKREIAPICKDIALKESI